MMFGRKNKHFAVKEDLSVLTPSSTKNHSLKTTIKEKEITDFICSINIFFSREKISIQVKLIFYQYELAKTFSKDYQQSFLFFSSKKIKSAIEILDKEKLLNSLMIKHNSKETIKTINSLLFLADLYVLNNKINISKEIYSRLLEVNNHKNILLKYALFLDLISDDLEAAFPIYKRIAGEKFKFANLHSFISFKIGDFLYKNSAFADAIVFLKESIVNHNSRKPILNLHSYKIKQALGKAFVSLDQFNNTTNLPQNNSNPLLINEEALGLYHSAVEEISKALKITENIETEVILLKDKADLLVEISRIYIKTLENNNPSRINSINFNFNEKYLILIKSSKFYSEKKIIISYISINEMLKDATNIYKAILEFNYSKETELKYGVILSEYAYFIYKYNNFAENITFLKKSTAQANLIALNNKNTIFANKIENNTSKIYY
ncbi:MAG: hypothetical protein JXL97_17020 [Bacteroidales bacterium]|nr:hypothetical protein [Bacteroidales bacterium]